METRYFLNKSKKQLDKIHLGEINSSSLLKFMIFYFGIILCIRIYNGGTIRAA